MVDEKIILGIDPGTSILGYGLISVSGKTMKLLTLGVINLQKFDDHYIKLQKIYKRLQGLIQEYCPDEMALEAPFFGKNVQSMLKLGRAQGVAMAAGLAFDIPITEYAPRKVKMAITGTGTASKEQVAAMLSRLLNTEAKPEFLDATDALAVAVCHYYQISKPGITQGTSAKSWKEFLHKNPTRVINPKQKN
jgi:crossover junction endodeoxyribonuclease RuvC